MDLPGDAGSICRLLVTGSLELAQIGTALGIDLNVVAVGARPWGPFYPYLREVRPFANFVGFDADSAASNSLAAEVREGWKSFQFLATTIGDGGPATLHVCRVPALSSLKRPDRRVVDLYPEPQRFDVVDEVGVETVTLPAALQGVMSEPDYLELDTQGSELDIIRSSKHLLTTSVLAARIEVWFSPFYLGQPVFEDIAREMRTNGFDLFDLRIGTKIRKYVYEGFRATERVNLAGPSPLPLPPKVPTKPHIVFADALYFRNLRTFGPTTDGASRRKLIKLAMIAMLFGHNDLAYQVAWDERVSDEVQRACGIGLKEYIELRTRAMASAATATRPSARAILGTVLRRLVGARRA